MDELIIQTWPLDRLIPYARNPRKNDAVVDKMASSIREFGFRIPIVAKSTGEVVDGHLRLKAARKLGLSEVPVALADNLSDAQVKAFRLLANRSANWAEWDNDLLRIELEELEALGVDTDIIGFDSGELEALELADDNPDSGDNDKYTDNVDALIYEPSGQDVDLSSCVDTTVYERIVKEIDESDIPDNEKTFLRLAAARHIVFRYDKVADYYAGKASAETQRLFERSALVIVDIDKAIENGFVRLSGRLKEIIGRHDAAQ